MQRSAAGLPGKRPMGEAVEALGGDEEARLEEEKTREKKGFNKGIN